MSEETYTVAGKSMPEVSIAVGLIFTLWGVAAYVISDMASLTAMIPLFVGGPIGAMGLLSQLKPEKRKAFMHVSAVFGLLCALGGLRLPMVIMDDGSSTMLIASHTILLVLGSVYTFLCVKSFIWIRKQREANEA